MTSLLRVSVEYGFEEIIHLFAFVDLQHLQKQYYVAALLTNCYICINGSQLSDYFYCFFHHHRKILCLLIYGDRTDINITNDLF